MDRSIVENIVNKIAAKCRRNLGLDDQVIDSSANASHRDHFGSPDGLILIFEATSEHHS